MAEDRVQRRLAAILAADVVGYSRLIEADEEGTRARLRKVQSDLINPQIEADGGRVVKTTGDGILVEFPSAVDAVRNAIAIQAKMADHNEGLPENFKLVFRVGINVGDVIIEGDDIHGDGVNVAARLETLCRPGEIRISGTVHDHVEGKLAARFEDLGLQTVKNISRPVRVYGVTPAPRPAGDASAPLPLPDKPSIAVLPFDNMSGDPEQEYFADGITEDIITALSRFRRLFVIARNSSFAFKGQSMDVTEIARKLGVQYLLEGSVRKAASRVRITAQLIDAATGRHVWADRFDRELEDIFDLQDEITRAIVSCLPGRMDEADREVAERKQTENLTAYDCLLLGLDQLKGMTPDRFSTARRHFLKAVELDPRYARAHALLAWSYDRDLYEETPVEGSFEKALNAAETALSLDYEDSWYHAVYGQLLFWNGEDERAEAAFRRATEMNPNDADAAALVASILVYMGRVTEGRERIAQAIRLNPYSPTFYHWYHVLALFSARDYDQAIRVLHEIRPLTRWGHAYLAACYAQTSRMTEAHVEMREFIEETESWLKAKGHAARPVTMDVALDRAARYRLPEDRQHFLDCLRKAGLPESLAPESPALPLPDKPSIAVLPFTNMSGDPEQEYFADGIAEDIITALSRFDWFFVIGRNSSFSFKHAARDVREVAEELGVQYVLEGSVRKASNRVRITAQLIDAPSGRHVWAERYDRQLDDIFAVQDEITEAITAAVAPSFVSAEARRIERKAPESLSAWDHVIRGNWYLWRMGKENVADAREHFRKGIERDPTSAIAYSGLAAAYSMEVMFGWSDDPAFASEEAFRAAKRAIELDEGNALAHCSLGFVQLLARRHDAAIQSCERALALNPNLAQAEAVLGATHGWSGNYDATLEHIGRAERLSPRDPILNYLGITRATAEFCASNYAKAAELANRAVNATPNSVAAWRMLASSSALLGRDDDARAALHQLLRLMPNLTVDTCRRTVPARHAEHLEPYLDGLRKAGLPA